MSIYGPFLLKGRADGDEWTIALTLDLTNSGPTWDYAVNVVESDRRIEMNLSRVSDSTASPYQAIKRTIRGIVSLFMP